MIVLLLNLILFASFTVISEAALEQSVLHKVLLK